MKITKSQLKQIIKEELGEALNEGPVDVPEIGMTQPKPVTPTQVRASQIFGDRNKIDKGVTWYRLGQHYSHFLYDRKTQNYKNNGKSFIKQITTFSPAAAGYFDRGLREGWGEDD